jgi:predicted dehydrogenase
VFGDKGALEWEQEDPNVLWFAPIREPKRKLTRAGDGTMSDAARVTRIPSGHPEGYLEGFANLYSEVGRAIRARRMGALADPMVTFPGIDDGVQGVRFIEAAVKSSSSGGIWVAL